MKRYTPKDIEAKWQKVWAETGLYEVSEDKTKKKVYATPMLPYPSGSGLHVGHVRNYTIADTVARYYRQRGHNVMSNMGWDAFGLPAENYAIKTGVPPWQTTADNIKTFKNQLTRLGMSYAWNREINTSDPSYYKWTQWIFTELFKAGLAYQGESLQWWCPVCKTVLADEQVNGGTCWRHEDTKVEKKQLKQWFFKITDYADELLETVDDLDWPEHIKTMQRNWIGRSVGAEIEFAVAGGSEVIKAFTTRPDTTFGATFIVLAPEHPLVDELTTAEQKPDVQSYVKEAETTDAVARMDTSREKTGVFTGSYAVNPASQEKIPIWVADYVLMDYGSGAIMAVPAHDQRDWEFAKKFDIDVTEVIEPQTGVPQKNPEFRRSIVAILRDPKNNKVLSINWGKLGGNLFVGGGREEKEDIVITATREIKEETGYKNFELISQTGKIHHSYYAASKKVERQIEAYGLLFDLVGEEKESTKLESDEKDKFKVEWLTLAEAGTRVKDELHAEIFKRLIQGEVYSGEGLMINSGKYDGMSSAEARDRIVADLAKDGRAKEMVNYRIHDWLISRQRYWGAPIPIIHCDKCGPVAVPEKDLPVELPKIKDFAPTGETVSVLAGVDEWVNVKCPKCDGPAKRETDTMDGYACSSWYMYRYTDPHNDKQTWSPDKANYWLPVDFYFGGDHAVSHLLYFRFWNRFFVDQGWIAKDKREPVKRLVYNGYINAEGGAKMSKSKGNVVDPLEIIDSGYGADALRLFELFIAPYDQDTSWSSSGVPGTYRFLQRVWSLAYEYIDDDGAPDNNQANELETVLTQTTHRSVKRVTDDLERMSFNTAVAALMELTNALNEIKLELPFNQAKEAWREALLALIQLLGPFAPHIAEELWQAMGQTDSVHVDHWPVWDEELVKEALVTVVVQVNGKLRANIDLPSDVSEEAMVKAAKEDKKVADYLKSGELVRTVTVPGRLVNFVIKT